MNLQDYFVNKPTNQLSGSITTETLAKSESYQFHKSLTYYSETPLIRLPNLANRYGVADIFLKDESFRFGLNAFKGLGTSYAISGIIQERPEIETFCTATDGNHGKALAWSAKLAGRKAVVFVPEDISQYRIKSIENEGGKVIKTEMNYDETCLYAHEICIQQGWQLVQDTSWDGYEKIPAQIMAGYLTIFKELESNLHSALKSNVDIVLFQAGVGSFAGSGVWYYVDRYGADRPKIVIAEPFESDGILESFKQGVLTSSKGRLKTIMSGLNCGIPSAGAWEILKGGVDAAMRVTDDYARQAIRELYYPQGGDPQIISGESGAGGVAGFIEMMEDERFKDLRASLNISKKSRILVYSTEGITDPEIFNDIVNVKMD